jgi:hypothetical protein
MSMQTTHDVRTPENTPKCLIQEPNIAKMRAARETDAKMRKRTLGGHFSRKDENWLLGPILFPKRIPATPTDAQLQGNPVFSPPMIRQSGVISAVL